MHTQISAAKGYVSTAPLFVNRLALLHDDAMAAKRTYKDSKLEDWQIADAKRLSALIVLAKKSQKWKNQDALAAQVQVTGSALSQWTTGKRPIPLERVGALATALNVDVDDISPTLAAMLANVKVGRVASPKPKPALTSSERRMGELNRAAFGALATLDKATQQTIRDIIFALATVKNTDYHTQYIPTIERFNQDRDSTKKKQVKGET
jgi:DNA-binding transcriptional regulator YdaS (Cro superfamily)